MNDLASEKEEDPTKWPNLHLKTIEKIINDKTLVLCFDQFEPYVFDLTFS